MRIRIITFLIAFALCATSALALSGNGGGGNSSGGTVTSFSAINGVEVTNPTTTPSLTIPNNKIYAAGYPGADFGAKVNAAIAALPSTGGIVGVKGK